MIVHLTNTLAGSGELHSMKIAYDLAVVHVIDVLRPVTCVDDVASVVNMCVSTRLDSYILMLE